MYDACSNHDVKLITGDVNAQIGKEAIYYLKIRKLSTRKVMKMRKD